jgi:predicted nucleic acid-binding protein
VNLTRKLRPAILVAARRAGASILWSEDLSDGQSYDGVTVQNPFKQPYLAP